MSKDILTSLALSLILTLVLESSFFLIVRRATNKYNKKDLLLLIMANIITNPVVVLSYWLAILYTDFGRVTILLPLEVAAMLTEGYIYNKYGRMFRHPYIFSAIANAFSVGIGMLIQMII